MTSHRWLGTGLILASLTAVAFAQAPALNIRMGLWEMTSTTNVGGEMPGIDTSKMTPEQKNAHGIDDERRDGAAPDRHQDLHDEGEVQRFELHAQRP